MNIYMQAPPEQIADEKKFFLSAIFKLLPYRQECYSDFDNYFESVLQKLIGFNKISGYQPVVISIISLIEYARDEEDFSKFRKAILDACGLVKNIKESDTFD